MKRLLSILHSIIWLHQHLSNSLINNDFIISSQYFCCCCCCCCCCYIFVKFKSVSVVLVLNASLIISAPLSPNSLSIHIQCYHFYNISQYFLAQPRFNSVTAVFIFSASQNTSAPFAFI